MLQQHEYLLIGAGATHLKEALGLRRPVAAGVKTETYWNNRVTPLPPGVHLLVREEAGKAPQLQLQQAPHPILQLGEVDWGESGAETGQIDEFFLQLALGGKRQSLHLPLLQPAETTGLWPDTRLHCYEERYCQEEVEYRLQQGITYFARNRQQQWVFIGAEPQAVYLTVTSPQPKLRGKVMRALAAAHALPTIPPANHAQQLTRMQAWWWGGERPINRPLQEQVAAIAHLELESKLAVQHDFSPTCWQLVALLQQGAVSGFTTYQDELLVRHSHDVVRYLKGKNKLILQGAAYRFGQKGLGSPQAYAHYQNESAVMIRVEEKPAYSPITTWETAQAIHQQVAELKPIGDIYCHKRKFTVQSQQTGGGYHILIDTCTALAAPETALAQIEIECQWKKIPPYHSFADPLATAISEIEQLTAGVQRALAGTQPTQLTKRTWLKEMLWQKTEDKQQVGTQSKSFHLLQPGRSESFHNY